MNGFSIYNGVFKNVPVLICGDIILDEYVYGDVSRISPEAPVPILSAKYSSQHLGGAGNVAANIASLQGTPYLVGVIGDDAVSNKVRQLAHLSNIQLKIPDIVCEGKTVHKLRMMQSDTQLLRLDHDVDYKWKEDVIPEILDSLPELPKCVIISDYNKGTVTSRLCRYIKDFCSDKNIPWIVDPKPRQHMVEMYNECFLIKPNKVEAEMMSGEKISDESSLHKAGKQLIRIYSSNVLITLGENGSQLFTKDGKTRRYYSTPVRGSHVAGAGDTTCAILALCIANDVSLEDACNLSNIASTIVVRKNATSMITIEDIKYNNVKIFSDIEVFEEKLNSIRTHSKIVFINGCFDIIHAGHLELFNRAREYGQYVVICLNTDESIKKIKGPTKPINTWEHRSKVLAGFHSVDAVIPIIDDSPADLFYKLKPDFVLHGDEGRLPTARGLKENEAIASYGGKKIYIEKEIPLSSTILLNKHSIQQ
jgi:D-beta-D-heptose 7-phosphate kinase/D-beta-D-heptose 1-phosphate adenosyltransferase